MRRPLEEILPPEALADIQEKLGGGTPLRHIQTLMKRRHGLKISLGGLSAMNQRMGHKPRRATKAEVEAARARIDEWPKRTDAVHKLASPRVSLRTIQKLKQNLGIARVLNRMEFEPKSLPKVVELGQLTKFEFFVECASHLPASQVVSMFPGMSLSKVYYWQRKLNLGSRIGQQLTDNLMARCGDRGWLIRVSARKVIFAPKIAPAAEILGVSERVLRYHLNKRGYNEKQARAQNRKDVERVQRMAREAELEDFAEKFPELESAIQANRRRMREEESRVEVSEPDAGQAEGAGAPDAEVQRPVRGGAPGHADSGADSPPPSDASERHVDRGESVGPERHAEAENFELAEKVHAEPRAEELHAGLAEWGIPVHDDPELPPRVVRLPRKRTGRSVQ